MKKGFTLIELLLYMSILSMLMMTTLMSMYYLMASSEKTREDLVAIDTLLFRITTAKENYTGTEPSIITLTEQNQTATINLYPTP